MAKRKAMLIAMSGVRIRNERLLALGMTLPGFVERGKVIASLPSLGLLTIAGCFPSNWEIEYRDVDELDDQLIDELIEANADLYALSTLTARAYETYALADRLRAAGRRVVIGGLHASTVPEETSAHADAIVIGEGERVWPELIADFENGTPRSQYNGKTATSPTFTFESAPLPRFDLLDIDRYNRVTIQTARGCPLDCSFCAASRLISPYRRKSIARVARELDAIHEIWPKPFLELADDNTFVHKRWARELVRLIGSYGVRWFTESDISVADDPPLLEALAESGCAQILVGLESVDSTALLEADTRRWKERRRADYIEKIQRIQSYGISINGCFVLGFDADRPSVFEQTRDFILESGLTEAQITVLTPFPGTSLTAKLKREGRLLSDHYWDKCTLFDVVYRPLQMGPSELEDGLRWLAEEIYRPDRTAERKARFASCVREARRTRGATQSTAHLEDAG